MLLELGHRRGKTPAQVALRFLTQQGIIAIPKSVHPARMRENLDSLSFDLTPEELQQISTLDTGRSLFSWW